MQKTLAVTSHEQRIFAQDNLQDKGFVLDLRNSTDRRVLMVRCADFKIVETVVIVLK